MTHPILNASLGFSWKPGGTAGLGVETARCLAAAGADVTITARSAAAGEKVAADITASGVKVRLLEAVAGQSADGANATGDILDHSISRCSNSNQHIHPALDTG